MMTPNEIAARLAAHAAWLRGESGTRLDLRDANLHSADLRNVDMRGANLRDANLHSADMRGAVLRNADLCNADLRSADMRGAVLRNADLCNADLRSADLRSADLRNADMRYADMRDAKLPPFQICPTQGAFIAFKGVYGRFAPAVLTLEIPAEARRTSSLVGRKCRAEYVRVLSGSGKSGRGGEYVEGEIYRSDGYDDDIRVECTHGVHFFMTREEAAEWVDIK